MQKSEFLKKLQSFRRSAQKEYNSGNYRKAKNIYNDYLYILNSSCDFSDLSKFHEVKDEFIDTVCNILKLEINEDNSIFKNLNDLRLESQTKIRNKTLLTKQEIFINSLKTYHINDTIPWGKFSGKKIIEIIQLDIEYLLWCIINLKMFSIDNVVFLLDDVYLLFDNDTGDVPVKKALEINLIKKKIIEERISEEDYSDPSYYIDDQSLNSNGPEAYGYNSVDEMIFKEVFEGNPLNYWNID